MMSLKKSAMYMCAVVGAMAGIYFLVIPEANQKRVSIERDTAEKRLTLVSLENTRGINRDIHAKTVELKRVLAAVEANLASPGETDTVVEEVWRLAEANSLQTQTIKTPVSHRFSKFREQDLDLTLYGDFSGFYQFLIQIENLKRVTRVKKLKLRSSDNGAGEVRAEMTLCVVFHSDVDKAQ